MEVGGEGERRKVAKTTRDETGDDGLREEEINRWMDGWMERDAGR